jgi:hypothetical protein
MTNASIQKKFESSAISFAFQGFWLRLSSGFLLGPCALGSYVSKLGSVDPSYFRPNIQKENARSADPATSRI